MAPLAAPAAAGDGADRHRAGLHDRVALVLGGGGPVGYAFHAGALAALAAAGFDGRDAGLVVGTSIGAVTGGLLRAGMHPDDLHARVTRTPLSSHGADLLERAGGWPTFPAPSATGAPRWGTPAAPGMVRGLLRTPRQATFGLLIAGLTNAGVVDTDPIARGLDTLIGGGWPQAPTWVCAVDLDSGHRMVFGRPGAPSVALGAAVSASCAVPSYFRPVEIAGRRYVDGGVHSPANTDVIGGLTSGLGRPAAVVVSLPMGASGPAGRRGLDLPGRRRNTAGARRGLAPLVEAGVPVLLLAPTARELEVMGYDAFDMGNLEEIARRSHATTAARIAAARRGEGSAADARAVEAVCGRDPLEGAQSTTGTGSGASGPT